MGIMTVSDIVDICIVICGRYGKSTLSAMLF